MSSEKHTGASSSTENGERNRERRQGEEETESERQKERERERERERTTPWVPLSGGYNTAIQKLQRGIGGTTRVSL